MSPPPLPPPPPVRSDLCHGLLTYATPGRAASTPYASTKRAPGCPCSLPPLRLSLPLGFQLPAVLANPRFSRSTRHRGKECSTGVGNGLGVGGVPKTEGGSECRRAQFPRARDANRSRGAFRRSGAPTLVLMRAPAVF